MADSLLDSTPCHTFLQNLITLSQVVAEESLTEDVHTHYEGVRDKNEKKCKTLAS